MHARPPVKWCGGKTKLLPQLMEHVPAKFRAYYEPFAGGAALFWHLRKERGFSFQARISDTCLPLIRTYRAIRNNPKTLIRKLRSKEYDETFYLSERSKGFDDEDDVTVAARFIYINKVCFNGLWRVNSKGGFNVPFGKHAKVPNWCDSDNIHLCSTALIDTELQRTSYLKVQETTKPRDLIYFDPPYYPLNTSSFTKYGKNDFGHTDHVRLRNLALELKERGCHVIISNSSAPEVRKLYRNGFDIFEVKAARSINRDGLMRGKITEFIIT